MAETITTTKQEKQTNAKLKILSGFCPAISIPLITYYVILRYTHCIIYLYVYLIGGGVYAFINNIIMN